MNRFSFLFLLALLPLCGAARECETVQYATNNGKALYLDHYRADSTYTGLRPCVIFVYPGGFCTGDKAEKRALSHFEWLCTEGFDVISIDYRTGYSKVYDHYGWKKGYPGVVQRMKTSVRWAAEDLLSATAFILKNAAAWQIDTKRIFASGSSAGAIACLQAENILCTKDSLRCLVPTQFNYAGIIAYAGAIFSTKGAPCWKRKPCPVLLFHGNGDGNVPYNKKQIFGIGFYGSAYLAKQFQKKGYAYTFYDADYRTHEMAIRPLDNNRAEILEFLRPADVNGQPNTKLQLHKHIHDGNLRKRQTKFSMKEYFRNNYQ